MWSSEGALFLLWNLFSRFSQSRRLFPCLRGHTNPGTFRRGKTPWRCAIVFRWKKSTYYTYDRKRFVGQEKNFLVTSIGPPSSTSRLGMEGVGHPVLHYMHGGEYRKERIVLSAKSTIPLPSLSCNTRHHRHTVNPSRAGITIPTCWFHVYAAEFVCTRSPDYSRGVLSPTAP